MESGVWSLPLLGFALEHPILELEYWDETSRYERAESSHRLYIENHVPARFIVSDCVPSVNAVYVCTLPSTSITQEPQNPIARSQKLRSPHTSPHSPSHLQLIPTYRHPDYKYHYTSPTPSPQAHQAQDPQSASDSTHQAAAHPQTQ